MLELLAISAMSLSIAAVWSPVRHAWIGVYSVFIILALLAQWIKPIALLSLSVFALVVWLSTLKKTKLVAVGVNTLVVLVTLVAAARLAPGFTNILLLEDTQLSNNTGWSALRFSADKVSIGLFLLVAHRELLCKTLKECNRILVPNIVPVIVGCLGMYLVGLMVGFATVDVTWSPLVFVWLFRNLIFTVVAEEAFFRGFIQSRLQSSIVSPHAPIYALLISAVLFGLVHIYGGWEYGFLATLAGILYGYVFMKTGRIELSIVAHSVLNTGHVILLSYP